MGSYLNTQKKLRGRAVEALRRKAETRNPEQQVDVDLVVEKRPNVFTFGRCSLNVSLAEDAGVYRRITGYDLS